jgi:hypothetical protein
LLYPAAAPRYVLSLATYNYLRVELKATSIGTARWVWVRCKSLHSVLVPQQGSSVRYPTDTLTRSIRVNGADCGAEAILLGVITSIGGFLFGKLVVVEDAVSEMLTTMYRVRHRPNIPDATLRRLREAFRPSTV